jgi:hypothetical protein
MASRAWLRQGPRVRRTHAHGAGAEDAAWTLNDGLGAKLGIQTLRFAKRAKRAVRPPA